MRSWVKYIALGLTLLIVKANFAAAPYYLVDSANAAYAKGNYARAMNFYSEFIDRGYETPSVYYNLGNCYYRTNDIAKAILYYEKAKRLAPNDADVLFNLQIANQKTTDKIAPETRLFLVNWWDNFINTTTEKGWAMICIVFLCLSLLLIIIYLLSPVVIFKQLSFWGGLLILAFCLFSFFIAQQQYKKETTHNSAIVMTPTVTVKGAPAENGTQLFVIHEGAKVYVVKKDGNWVEVKLSNGNQGWILATDIAVI
jgi:tetratricopeptide (TPR) repeat protein